MACTVAPDFLSTLLRIFKAKFKLLALHRLLLEYPVIFMVILQLNRFELDSLSIL